MKMISLACFAGLLAATPLRAQEPPAASPSPAPATDTRSQADEILQNPLVQQLLHVVVQKALDMQGSVASGETKGNDISSMATNFLSGLFDAPTNGGTSASAALPARPTGFSAYSEARFASEPGERRFNATSRAWVTRPWNDAERAQKLAGFQQDYSRLSASERARWDIPTDDPTLAHAWDSLLSSSGLRTGGLHSGGLQTGGLATGRVDAGSTSSSTLPQRDFVTPSASSAPTANTPPGDPDEEMRRWSQGIDRQFTTEQAARNAAVQTYPDLGVADSAFNTQFRARYAQYRQADPFGFLRGPGWPMKLAIFTDGDLKRQKAGTAAAP